MFKSFNWDSRTQQYHSYNHHHNHSNHSNNHPIQRSGLRLTRWAFGTRQQLAVTVIAEDRLLGQTLATKLTLLHLLLCTHAGSHHPECALIISQCRRYLCTLFFINFANLRPCLLPSAVSSEPPAKIETAALPLPKSTKPACATIPRHTPSDCHLRQSHGGMAPESR